jgi:hypothetical protein
MALEILLKIKSFNSDSLVKEIENYQINPFANLYHFSKINFLL